MNGQTLEGARGRLITAAREWARLHRATELAEHCTPELDRKMEAAENRLLACVDAVAQLERDRPS